MNGPQDSTPGPMNQRESLCHWASGRWANESSRCGATDEAAGRLRSCGWMILACVPPTPPPPTHLQPAGLMSPTHKSGVAGTAGVRFLKEAELNGKALPSAAPLSSSLFFLPPATRLLWGLPQPAANKKKKGREKSSDPGERRGS